MRELVLHLLDIAHNSVSARASNITISVMEDSRTDRLRMVVEDDGVGMDEETVQHVIDPFFTSRITRNVGLGIPLLKAAAEACDGFLEIQSTPDIGTRVTVEFQHSHIDRMPLGNLADTILMLVVGCPQVHWQFFYKVNDRQFSFDDAEIKNVLQDVPLTEPEILAYLRNLLEEGIADLQKEIQTRE